MLMPWSPSATTVTFCLTADSETFTLTINRSFSGKTPSNNLIIFSLLKTIIGNIGKQNRGLLSPLLHCLLHKCTMFFLLVQLESIFHAINPQFFRGSGGLF